MKPPILFGPLANRANALPFVMKQYVDTYVQPITILINKSFYHGIFHDELKLARVVPIFKSGDSSKINNYRPISILSFFQQYMND